MKRGEYGCRCECCVYWRRHTHRVAGNRDREARKHEVSANYHRAVSESKGEQVRLHSERLSALKTKERRQRAEIAGLKEELRRSQRPSLLKRLLGI